MIDLYSWPTPNGQKVHIMLEELGVDYTTHAIDITAGQQFDESFLSVSPNNRIPAIVDRDGPGETSITVFESGAILIYLAEKWGRYYPTDIRQRVATNEWLMFQMANVGPMFGQVGHFFNYAPEEVPYAKKRYLAEAERLTGVLNRRLSANRYLVGDEYTIADIATFPWVRFAKRFDFEMGDYSHVVRWLNEIKSRPATQSGLSVLSERRLKGPISEEARRNLFGDKQHRDR